MGRVHTRCEHAAPSSPVASSAEGTARGFRQSRKSDWGIITDFKPIGPYTIILYYYLVVLIRYNESGRKHYTEAALTMSSWHGIIIMFFLFGRNFIAPGGRGGGSRIFSNVYWHLLANFMSRRVPYEPESDSPRKNASRRAHIPSADRPRDYLRPRASQTISSRG